VLPHLHPIQDMGIERSFLALQGGQLRRGTLYVRFCKSKSKRPFLRVDLPPSDQLAKMVCSYSYSGQRVNPLDTKIRAGVAAHAKQPLPAVLGLDMAGTVGRGIGSGVTRSNLAISLTAWFGGVGGLQVVTLAELIAVDANRLRNKPQSLVYA